MATLLLIRHGQASYGQVDYDRLSERGIAQARAVGEHVGTLDALYVGPLKRQQQTAAELAKQPAPTTLAEFAEYPGFDMVSSFMPKLILEDADFAQLQTKPTRELAD